MKTRLFVGVLLTASFFGVASSLTAAEGPTAIPLGALSQVSVEGVDSVSSPSPSKPSESEKQASPAGSTRPASGSQGSLTLGWSQLRELFLGFSGVPMWALVACSILTFMFVIERLTALQSRRIVPRAFVTRFLQNLRDGELDRAKVQELTQVCRENDSPIARLFAIVVENGGRPAFEIRVTVSDLAESELFHLKKHIRAISGLAMLAPLLGLFGTVLGMISAFHALSQQSGTGKTELLASGISLALVATASGLAVAVVASAAYYFLLGRVDMLIQEMDVLTNQAVSLVSSDGRSRGTEKKTPRVSVIPTSHQKSV
jgi:biopolymer transport protein ExbB